MKEQWNLRTQREYKEDNGYWRRVHSAQGVEHGHFRERTMLREATILQDGEQLALSAMKLKTFSSFSSSSVSFHLRPFPHPESGEREEQCNKDRRADFSLCIYAARREGSRMKGGDLGTNKNEAGNGWMTSLVQKRIKMEAV